MGSHPCPGQRNGARVAGLCTLAHMHQACGTLFIATQGTAQQVQGGQVT